MKKLHNKYIATDEVHPGEILKDELTDMNLKAVNLSEMTGLSKSFISQLLKGDRSITAAIAVKLQLALGIPAEHWLKMQCDYDISIAWKELEKAKSATKKKPVAA